MIFNAFGIVLTRPPTLQIQNTGSRQFDKTRLSKLYSKFVIQQKFVDLFHSRQPKPGFEDHDFAKFGQLRCQLWQNHFEFFSSRQPPTTVLT